MHVRFPHVQSPHAHGYIGSGCALDVGPARHGTRPASRHDAPVRALSWKGPASVGVEDNGGTGTRTETADRPTSGERHYTSPPDNPGSPGQQSRLESRARTQQDQQQNAPQDTGGAQSIAEPREGKQGLSQTGGAAESTGSQNTSDSGQGSPRTDQPRSRDPGARTGGSSLGRRDGPQAEDETDTRTEPADKPAPSTQAYTLPADRPGQSGQQSRLESRARTRQDQEQYRAQDAGTAGSEPGDREDRPSPPQSEADSQKADAATAGRDTSEARKDEHAPANGEGRRDDEREQETGPLNTTTPGKDSPRDQDRPAPEQARSQAPETPRPQDQEHPPLPRQEPVASTESRAPSEAEQSSQGTEAPADGTGAQAGDTEAQPSAEDGEAEDQMSPPEAEEGNEQPPSQPSASETGERQTADSTSSSSEETAEDHGAPEPHTEDTGGRGKKAEDDGTQQNPNEVNETSPEAHPNPILSDVYTDSSGQVQVEPRYGREQSGRPGAELVRNETQTTDPVELPTREDLDPVGAQGGETGRGELREPDDDPASRDYQESDPDNPSPGRDSLRRFLNTASDAKDAASTYSETAQKNLERVQPTGQLSGARADKEHIGPPDQSVKVGDAVVGAVGATIVVTEVVRSIINLARQTRRREHADN
ncbi:hypothetical protein SAMN05443665_100482 [Actinomadura meyerae]|uniref:Uncharacterized protein n=1 Tax=Actinomadura meyerae TaxID=240840 RepID=A0A239EJ23_9ACTN|nr:hypothetical protein SAMN05443665_100482 [Actinomadura meyerae]